MHCCVYVIKFLSCFNTSVGINKKMKYFSTISILILVASGVLGQNHKFPPKGTYYPISKQICEYQRQNGKLEIIRNDSLMLTRYKTDSSEMVIYADHFRGFLTDWEKKDEANQIYSQLDSLISTLFLNGLLTSDLIIKSYCVESKYIDYKGDTLDWTNHLTTNTVKILNIQKMKLPKQYRFKHKKKIVAYEIWVTFNSNEDGWGSFPMFDLIIKSDIKFSDYKINEYLKNAEIKCLIYTATQI